MQYRAYVSRSNSPERFDCASNHPNHPKCLLSKGSFEIEVPDFHKAQAHKRIIESPADVWEYLDYAISLVPEYDYVEHLLNVAGINICPASVISPEIYELARMVGYANRGLWPVGGGYFEQPLYLIEAIDIMNAEENRLLLKARQDG